MNYPEMKADLDLCYRQLFELCKGERKEAIMSIPPTEKDFDMQFSAAFDELIAYRNTGLTPEDMEEEYFKRADDLIEYEEIGTPDEFRALKTSPALEYIVKKATEEALKELEKPQPEVCKCGRKHVKNVLSTEHEFGLEQHKYDGKWQFVAREINQALRLYEEHIMTIPDAKFCPFCGGRLPEGGDGE